jgi:signal transduction histidine kinase
LVALAADAERLRAAGLGELADDLDQLAHSMRRRVDRELIRGRIRARRQRPPQGLGSAGGGATVTDLGATLDGVVRTLARTPRGAGIDWELDCPPGIAVILAPEDLAELLGNVLENAVQWARGRVAVRVARRTTGPDAVGPGDWVEVQVQDDGPGVPESALQSLGQRGLRLDQRTQGSGLGLAIVQDICDAYEGTVAFTLAAMGGLTVRLDLPAVPVAETGR